eukprot:scaffold25060_cov75-Isochrysis_galbana.AAC.3
MPARGMPPPPPAYTCRMPPLYRMPLTKIPPPHRTLRPCVARPVPRLLTGERARRDGQWKVVVPATCRPCRPCRPCRRRSPPQGRGWGAPRGPR